MIFAISSLLAILGYLVGGWRQRQLMQSNSDTNRQRLSKIGIIAWLAHTVTVFMHVFTPQGLLLDLGAAIALTAWCVTGVVLYSSLRKPAASLLVVIMPLSALCLAFAIFTPPTAAPMTYATELLLHILFSFLAYSLFAIAALQAVILAYQNTVLKSHHSSPLLRSLPPLQTMESLLFEMLATGTIMLTLALITGFIYLDDMFAQQVAHKTFLSVCAWSIFASLLVGHYRFGWRGRTAIRWTLAGFSLLVLAYFGSKLVIEYLL
ncbi:MAG: cytochrome c biogenesis protein CcsA [Gammaproteobacteria bacterium]|jgi:ABC-type uncharacterized transport system permease subunit|nr:cytochrome c biogenesis protein CcsA [Gammaproteobacteria bacterium]MCP4879734.1 cytochrome c biogenesis protein CcsA [Gammaproteobacteria bacterium]MDP6164972.1 cytochrome c biogenesis protein CcsA [Gammaproteobacteria bacterium]